MGPRNRGAARLAALGVGSAVLVGLAVAGRFLLGRLHLANASLVGRLRQLLIHR